jgi:tetratricopeptide (TPR) repeat protein
VGALLILSAVALMRWPKVGFLGAWLWITLAPTSSILPIATEVGAERRIYLGLMALATLAVIGGAALLRRFQSTARVAAVAVVAILFLALTIARNAEYSSPIVLAQTSLARYPTPVGHHVLATELLAVGQEQAAMEELHKALPGAPRAHFTLGVELMEHGQLDAGIAEMHAFIQNEPHLGLAATAHDYLGRAYAQRQRWPEAIAEFQAKLALKPDDVASERLLADAYFNNKNLPQAIDAYQRYTAAAPSDAEALNQLGVALGQTGRLADAANAFAQAASADPQDGAIERNLSLVLYQQHDIPSALVHAERAVALQPDDEGSRQLLRTLRLAR